MVLTLFFYGTLCHPPILRAVLGREPVLRRAVLPGYRSCLAADHAVPMILPAAGEAAPGAVIDGLSAEEVDRLDYYEAGFGYHLAPVTVTVDGHPVAARAYLPDDTVYRPGGPWSLSDWVAQHGAEAEAAAGDYMALWPKVPRERAVRLYPQILQRAASRVRAGTLTAPVRLRRGGPASAVRIAARRVPYMEFFALEEQDLTFPTFSGGDSALVTRAAFVAGDAVTVLPYDPVRDRVLVVEQFRFGAHVRGDPCPWSLEPIAGRIDAGETPEEAARREAVEEAGLSLGRLIPIGRYYPAPGASTEYLVSYLGLADLPDEAARLGGLATEAEDIRALLLEFDALMALLDSNEAENAPLRLSILELARRRDSLRA